MTQKPKYDTLVLITDAFPTGGATEPSFVLPELKLLSERFGRVIIVPTVDLGEDPARFELPENVAVDRFWIDHPDWRHRWRRLRFALRPEVFRGNPRLTDKTFAASACAYASALKRWIRRNGIDTGRTLFYTFWFDFPTAALGMLARKAGLRYMSRAHYHDIYADRAMLLRRQAIERSLGIFCAGEAGACHLRDEVQESADSIVVEHLGNTKLFPSRIASFHRRNERNLTFLSVSRVTGVKRVDLNYRFMRALAIARPATAIRWIHAGDGDLMESLRADVASDCPANLTVELRGRIDNEAVQRIYAEEPIDWTMLLSEGEGLPIAVCESLSYGVPVIATMVRGTDEIVNDDCGLPMPADPEPEEFVRGLLPYLDSDERTANLREGALRRWRESFDAAALRHSFVEKLQSL